MGIVRNGGTGSLEGKAWISMRSSENRKKKGGQGFNTCYEK